MRRDVCGRRGRLPRSADSRPGRDTQDNGWERLEHRERDRGRECRLGRTRLMSRRERAASVGHGLGDLGSGRALPVMMHRTRAVSAALHACFGRRLPAGALRHRALSEREHANDRGHLSQDRPHTLGCVVAVGPVKRQQFTNLLGGLYFCSRLHALRLKVLRDIADLRTRKVGRKGGGTERSSPSRVPSC